MRGQVARVANPDLPAIDADAPYFLPVIVVFPVLTIIIHALNEGFLFDGLFCRHRAFLSVLRPAVAIVTGVGIWVEEPRNVRLHLWNRLGQGFSEAGEIYRIASKFFPPLQ